MTGLILYYLIAVNVLTFIVYDFDKRKARRKRWRIPEATLLGLAVIGGSVGAWIAMHIFHHKTLHNKFRYGIPVIFLLQTALALYLLLY